MKKISLKSFGSNLGSRLYARDIFQKISPNIDDERLILDLSGVEFSSLSFATELIDSIYKKYPLIEIEIENATDLIESIFMVPIKSFKSVPC